MEGHQQLPNREIEDNMSESEEDKPTILTPEIMRVLDEIAKREGLSRNKALEAAVAKLAASGQSPKGRSRS